MSHWARVIPQVMFLTQLCQEVGHLSLTKETSDKKWTIQKDDYIFDATQEGDANLGEVMVMLKF